MSLHCCRGIFVLGVIILEKDYLPFLTYQQQLKKLVDKKLLIADTDYAISILKSTSYYSLICGYKDIFKDKSTGYYTNEATFENIFMLYSFDEELRGLFLKYILKVERKFKSLYSYAFCSKYGENQSEYLNVNNYNYMQFQNDINDLMGFMRKGINNNKPYIQHHTNKYSNVPLWVLVNVLTFGNMSIAYQCLTPKLQSLIAYIGDIIIMKKLILILKKIFEYSVIVYALHIIISAFVLIIIFGIITSNKNDIKFKPSRQLNSIWASANPNVEFSVNNAKCFGKFKFNERTINIIVTFGPGRDDSITVEDYDAMIINNFEYSPKTQLFEGSCKFYKTKCVVTITESYMDNIKVSDKITFVCKKRVTE